MNSFQITQTLAAHARFTVFEARGDRFQFPVVLKWCEYREASEVEFFIRSALMKTKTKAYSQPLLSIFADVDGDKSFIAFVWRKGNAWDIEVERDEESQFLSGKAGYAKSKVLYKNPHTQETVKRALCLTFGKEVVLKPRSDAPTQMSAKSSTSGCIGKSGRYSSYIVMESLKQDLAMEIQERKLQEQPYDEVELMIILKQVVAALLYAKSQDLAHQDIKPHNILKGSQGLKLTDFGSTWLKGLHFKTLSAMGTEMYISPEAWEAIGNPKTQHRPFESDVFSLGMTMLHLAATELPERTSTMSLSELQSLLQRKVRALGYSEELKRLLTAMLSTTPSDRPPLETLQVDAESIYRQATQGLEQEARRLRLQARSNINEGKDAMAIELAAAAHALYSRLPEGKDTASNLHNLGNALYNMGKSAEAVVKYEAAQAIYSRFPEDKDTANNLHNWGLALYKMGRSAEAMEKYATAHAIYSRFSEGKSSANNLKEWGVVLWKLGRSAEAVEKISEAHTIYSRFPENKSTARNLYNWGLVLWKMGRRAEAVEKYGAAHAIYFRLSRDGDTATNLYNWGLALRRMERTAEAVEKHEVADAIYSRLSEDKNTATNLYNWGLALRRMERTAEAVEKHEAADAIYSRLSEDKSTAINLYNWGLVLWKMGRRAEAVEKYAAAYSIYSRLPEDKDTAVNLNNLRSALERCERLQKR